jgi:hypothetical protein
MFWFIIGVELLMAAAFCLGYWIRTLSESDHD